ncbi:hypothetical protein OS122_29780 [Mycolicibacterium mucogenicum]|uniref:hypothetical protein n=1 Tax=Mycolicibacterium mucogenicum TaxID=56689 RepID=UPI00226A1B55|nr:hypothetical protein [Mycolicibacterium mucogenicum]MCX8565077.1 hypothetical protein [Mycolicibacterium mucogenicum]
MSKHHRHRSNAIPVRQFLATGTTIARAETPARYVALTAATAVALAFTPAIIEHAPAPHLRAVISAPTVDLTALVSPSEVTALRDAVTAELNNLDQTVATIVAVPGQTLAAVLSSASALSKTFWNALTAAAGPNPLLVAALSALSNLTTGGLSTLSTVVSSANTAIVLSTEQVASLLTSTLTAAAATAGMAVSSVIANPLSLAGLGAIADAPFTIAGHAVSAAITAAANLGHTALGFGASLVTTATAQINSVIDSANSLISAMAESTGNNVIDGIVTAAQAVVTAPLTALLAGVSGGTTTLTGAAGTALNAVAGAAQDLNTIWLGGTTGNGAIQAAINAIISGPLSAGSYLKAVTTLTQAAIATVTKPVITLAAGVVTMPLTVGSGLVGTGADVLTALVGGITGLAAGLGIAAGLPSPLIGTIYTVGKTVNAGINLAAAAMQAGLNTAATLIGAVTKATGLATPAAEVPSTANTLVGIAAIKPAATTLRPATAPTPAADPKTPTATDATKPVAKAATTATDKSDKTSATSHSVKPDHTTAAAGEPGTSTEAADAPAVTRAEKNRASATSDTTGNSPAKTPATPKHAAPDTKPKASTSSSDPSSVSRASKHASTTASTSSESGKHAAAHHGGDHA